MYGTLNQPYILLAYIYAGILLGIVYSLFRLLRRLVKAGPLFTALLDTLFILLSAVLFFVVLYYSSNMSVRLYHYFGTLLGFCIYMFAISPLVKVIYKSKQKVKSKKKVDNAHKNECNNR